MKKLLFIYFLLLITNQAILLSKVVEGKVIDAKTGEALPGATISIVGTNLGVIAQKDGYFKIPDLNFDNFTLKITYIGYYPKKISIKRAKDTSFYLIKLVPKTIEKEEIIVTAGKRVQAVQEVPISYANINSSSVLDMGHSKVDEALIYISGVEVNKDNVSIRGSSGFSLGVGSRILLLVDGFPLLSGDTGEMKYDAISLFKTERIEVVKGAGSALYGTGAIGGVINIITKEPADSLELSLRAGNGIYTKPRYKQWEYSNKLHSKNYFDFSVSKSISKLSFILSGGYSYDESYRLFDKSRKFNLFTKINYKFDKHFKSSIFFSYADDYRDNWVYWNSLDSATYPPSNINTNEKMQSNKLTFYLSNDYIINNENFLSLKLGVFRTFNYNNYPSENKYYRQSDANSYYFEIQSNNNISEKIFLTSGINLHHNQVNSNIFGGKKYQNNLAIYSQLEYSAIKNLILTIGGRLDYEKTVESNYNFQISPKFAGSYTLNPETQLRFSIGNGFRSPTIGEKFASVPYSGFDVVPNLNLKPEKSWSFEVGVNHYFTLFNSEFYFDLAIFDNEMKDLIEPSFVEKEGLKISFQNITRARILGTEITLRALLFNLFGFETGLTAMYPKDLTLNQTLKYRSNILFNNKFFIPFDFIEVQADYRFKSRVEKIDDILKLQVKDYDARVPIHIFDLRTIIKFQKFINFPIKLTLGVNNLFDYYYTEMVGNLGTTRTIFIQITYN